MKKILLIEDDQRVAHAIGIALKAMGYEVATASDAVLATQQARKANADVIILDINLPGGDGFVVAERLKKPGPNGFRSRNFHNRQQETGTARAGQSARSCTFPGKAIWGDGTGGRH